MMTQFKGHTIAALVFANTTIFSSYAMAKGVDDIAPPPVDQAAKVESKSESQPAPPAATPTATPVPDKKPVAPEVTAPTTPPVVTPPTSTGPETKPEVKEESQKSAGEAVPPPVVEPSAMSKRLQDKFYLAPGLGLGSFKGSKGVWSNRGFGYFEMGYRVKEKAIRELPLFAAMTYMPISSTISYNSQSYRSITHGLLFTANPQLVAKEHYLIFVDAGIGYFTTSASTVDYTKVDSAVEKSGASIVAGSSIVWKIKDKMTFGPRVSLGVGAYQFYQVSMLASFLF